jgi:hypothetical protein
MQGFSFGSFMHALQTLAIATYYHLVFVGTTFDFHLKLVAVIITLLFNFILFFTTDG